MQALSRQLGGKPILYAVNTSSHGDHSFGNMYLPASTKIVQPAVTRQYIAGHLDDDKAFVVKNFGSGRGIEAIKARTPDIVVAACSTVSLDLAIRKSILLILALRKQAAICGYGNRNRKYCGLVIL